MDATAGVKRLVPKAVDPELLKAVVGPRLASTWVEPLRAQYSRFQQAYPKDWVDVEKVWREQRERWRPLSQERARCEAGRRLSQVEVRCRVGPRTAPNVPSNPTWNGGQNE